MIVLCVDEEGGEAGLGIGVVSKAGVSAIWECWKGEDCRVGLLIGWI